MSLLPLYQHRPDKPTGLHSSQRAWRGCTKGHLESLILPLDAAREQMPQAKPTWAPHPCRATAWSLRPPLPALPGSSPVQAELVLPVSFIPGSLGSLVAGKCQPSLGNVSRGCVSPCAQTCWRLLIFRRVAEQGIGPRVCVCMHFLQVTGERRVWVLIRVCGQLC